MIRYTITSAFRDRLYVALLLMLAAAAALSAFAGGTSILEQRELAAAFVGASSRLILVLGLVLFVCFHVQRQADGQEIILLLSRPISRSTVVFAYASAFGAVALMSVAIATLAVILVSAPPSAGLGLWAGSVLIECLIMVLVALFFVLILQNAVASALAALALYVLARMIGLLTGAAGLAVEGSIIDRVIAWIMQIVSIIVPRLDLFAQTRWLVYGAEGENHIDLILLQAVVYVPLVLAASIFDFRRRQF